MKLRVIALCGVLLLTGCAVESEPTESPRPVASAPDPEDNYPSPDPDYMDAVRAKLGPVPVSEPLTPEQEVQALAADADLRWETVTHFFPDEPRPNATVISIADDGDYVEAILPCFASRDVPVTPTFGNRGYGNDNTDREDVVNQYLCEVEYPARPRPPLTPTQLGYLYDYFVQFKAPCLQGLGYELMPPTNAPSKDVFVTDWPRQGWNPSPVTGLDAEAAAVELACPSYPDGLR